MLQDLMISDTRVRVLKVLFKNPEDVLYVREIVDWTSCEINAVRRELDRFVRIGLITQFQLHDDRRVYNRVNPGYIFYTELYSMVLKEIKNENQTTIR